VPSKAKKKVARRTSSLMHQALRRAENGAACEKCGCTEDAACLGGCSWRTEELLKGRLVCSSCVP